MMFVISIHAPRGGSDKLIDPEAEELNISIHAPRGGSDHFRIIGHFAKPEFQSTLPVGGATRKNHRKEAVWKFQSTLPVGGATSYWTLADKYDSISIHAPRGGSD